MAVLTRQVIHVRDLAGRSGAKFPRTQLLQGPRGVRTLLVVPLLRDGAAIGVISMRRQEVRPFSARQIDLVRTFADEAVIALENTRLFKELQDRNTALTEALEQQTATGDILRAISQSPRDVQPVFETIGASALKLCRATSGAVYTFDGELIHLATPLGLSPEAVEKTRQTYPMRPGRGGATARAILNKELAYVPDVREDPEFRVHDMVQTSQHRCIVSVPMLREGSPIGAITVGGAEPAMFSERQIALLKTFADQAIIAVENVRLVRE
jgi:GAF domain-containing protein